MPGQDRWRQQRGSAALLARKAVDHCADPIGIVSECPLNRTVPANQTDLVFGAVLWCLSTGCADGAFGGFAQSTIPARHGKA
jgi:hypothetical protein